MKINHSKVTTLNIKHEISLTGRDILRLLLQSGETDFEGGIPDRAMVVFRGRHWMVDADVDVDEECPIIIRWETTKTQDG